MKLKHFKGINVRGYLNFDINFRGNLTFLIGINGSGKTTVLKLISGLLTPSYYDLSSIEYEVIELTCEMDDKSTIIISSENKKDKFEMSLKIENREVIKNDFSIFSSDSFSQEYSPERLRERMEIDFYDSEVVKALLKYERPIILGINRRLSINYRKNSFTERDVILRRRRLNSNRNYDVENVDEALLDVQELLYSMKRLIALKQEKTSERFRKGVIEEALKISNIANSGNFENYQNYKEQLEKLDERELSIDKSIEDLGLSGLKETFENFFKNVRGILEVLSNDTEDKNSDRYNLNLMNWILNYWQLEKIDNITNLGIEYRENIAKLKEPITRLIDTLNKFLKEGNKEIDIDRRGDLYIRILNSPEKKRNRITEISSGEKQLIIMLGHLAFRENNRNSVVIIDEPELSLHLSWQEIFVEALLNTSKNTQFILATHAPAIIANQDWQNNCVDLSERE